MNHHHVMRNELERYYKASLPEPSRWSLLMTGPNEGLVGEFGETFPAHSPLHRRVNVYANPTRQSMDYRTVPLSVSIARANQHPVYGEVMVLTLEDEGGGAFFKIHDNNDANSGIRVELEELELMVIEARKLMAGVKGTRPHNMVMP